MKRLSTIFSFVIIFLVVVGSFGSVARASNQPKGAISQSEDLCGGTGGNGKIVSVGGYTFTLKLNDNARNEGGNLIVSLTTKGSVQTSTGNVSMSDLKIGDRITLVGSNNRDGTFTADAVVVCSGTGVISNQANGKSHAASISVRNNDANYERISGVIHVVTILLVGLLWLGIFVFLKLKKRKSFIYLFFFTIFYIYLYKVLDYALLQFQSLLLLKHFLPSLMLNGVEAGRTVNLIPLVTLTLEDVKTSLLNILMMMPFGFGLPFITDFRMKTVVVLGLLFSISIELLQLLTGFMANTTFRIADINDLIFNTIGVTLGYILFVGFIRNFGRIFQNSKISTNPIMQYIAKRPQIKDKISRSD